MSASIDAVVARLERVRAYGQGYRARCPSCGGKRNDTVSVTTGDDGRVLLHCFGGCAPADVVQAIGLELGDLFPERPAAESTEDRRRMRLAARQAGWGAALELLEFEARVVLIAAADVLAGKPLADQDHARLVLAVERIESARQELRPVDLRNHLRDMAKQHEAMRG